MGFLGDMLDDVLDKIKDFASFFVIYTAVVFILGMFYAGYSQGRGGDFFWYPFYFLLIALAWKALKDMGKGKAHANSGHGGHDAHGGGHDAHGAGHH